MDKQTERQTDKQTETTLNRLDFNRLKVIIIV